ncbi:MAG: TOBE domain-containing protein, partial [Comamonas sp.]|nr:TOBE domain-containing protein [Comamonas sp.]
SSGRVDFGFAELSVPTGSYRPGQKVHALIRPEHIEPDPQPGQTNTLQGRPGACRYLGSLTRYDFAVEGAPRAFLAEGRQPAGQAIAIAPEHIRLLDA